MEKNRSADRDLEVEIRNGELVFRIGVSELCRAVRECSLIEDAVMEADGDESAVRITDESAFASAILDALLEEDEDGTTPVHLLLDAAAERAIENGCRGIEFAEDVEDGKNG